MTLARNIELVPSNWSGGVVGNGYLPRGNSNLGRAGSSLDPEGTGYNKRTFKLTNGEVIWDLSGNVWELINDTISIKDMVDSYNSDGTANNLGWNEDYNVVFSDYHFSDYSFYYLDYLNLGNTTLKYKDLFLLNPNYDINNGVGRIHTHSNRSSVDNTINTYARGGKYNGDNGGILSSYFQIIPNDFGFNFGFRCVIIS
jgi:hypothetical protein